ncbi:hypothetical protein ZWY2020_033496 [Hordeum vulgare]|nr:hypothetical protein ZWY2020_033496 [Hordeum vulgare]
MVGYRRGRRSGSGGRRSSKSVPTAERALVASTPRACVPHLLAYSRARLRAQASSAVLWPWPGGRVVSRAFRRGQEVAQARTHGCLLSFAWCLRLVPLYRAVDGAAVGRGRPRGRALSAAR